jgi:hypothetical protein
MVRKLYCNQLAFLYQGIPLLGEIGRHLRKRIRPRAFPGGIAHLIKRLCPTSVPWHFQRRRLGWNAKSEIADSYQPTCAAAYKPQPEKAAAPIL